MSPTRVHSLEINLKGDIEVNKPSREPSALEEYINKMTVSQRKSYAVACGTSYRYLMNTIRSGAKEARSDLRKKLAENSGGEISYSQVLVHFRIIGAE